MDKRIIIPRQNIEVSLDRPRICSAYEKLVLIYDVNRLGIQMEPVADPLHGCKLGLPGKARLVVEHDITIEDIIEALKGAMYDVTDVWGNYYILPRLFKNVAKKRTFIKETIQLIDGLAFSDTTGTLTLSADQVDQALEFEFVITPFKQWKFVRLQAVVWAGNRFEYWVRKPDGRNVYSKKSKNVAVLRRCLPIILTTDDSTAAFNDYMARFLPTKGQLTFINDDLALHVQIDKVTYRQGTLDVNFGRIDADYTMFLG
jgi:hypothetical protein